MLEIREAGFWYRPDRWVFRNHSLKADAGDVVAILGPNGRGKTTLLKSIIGLARLKSGSVRLGASYGYVPQAHRTVFDYSVLDIVVMGRARQIGMFRSPARRDLSAATDALASVGAAEFAERRYGSLSGGEQQLVLIARALASECRILVLDEPTSALDYRNQDRVLVALRELASRRNMLVVFTTHVPGHALHVASHALLMFGGDDYSFGPAAEMLCEAALTRLYDIPIARVSDGRAGASLIPVYS